MSLLTDLSLGGTPQTVSSQPRTLPLVLDALPLPQVEVDGDDLVGLALDLTAAAGEAGQAEETGQG